MCDLCTYILMSYTKENLNDIQLSEMRRELFIQQLLLYIP